MKIQPQIEKQIQPPKPRKSSADDALDKRFVMKHSKECFNARMKGD
jgi:hypothetical protein